jgi:hypothetical protein
MAHKPKTGPEADQLVVEGNWKDAITRAVKKTRPVDGWPDRPVKKRRKRKTKSK